MFGHRGGISLTDCGPYLIDCQHPASSDIDGIFHHRTTLQRCDPSAALDQLAQLISRFERQLSGQSSLQVRLKELAVPSVGQSEGEVDLCSAMERT